MILRRNSDKEDNVKKILIFNTTGQRDAEKFLKLLSTHNFQYAIFTTNVIYPKPGNCSDSNNNNVGSEEARKVAETNMMLWKKLVPSNEDNCTVIIKIDTSLRNTFKKDFSRIFSIRTIESLLFT